MQKRIITTVGTSMLENYNTTEVNDCMKNDYKAIGTAFKEIKIKSNTSSINYDDYDIEIEEITDIIQKNWFKGIHKVKDERGEWKWKKEVDILNKNASAEITSILAIANEAKDDETIEVHLIATDTVLSVLAAELIKCWFNENEQPNIKVVFERPEKLKTQADSKHIIHKLSITSNKDYQEGFMNLIEVVSGLIDENKRAKEETILNITGGYKAIIPIMTLLGQIKSVPLKYIYEESNLDDKTELVEVGNLPISFDWGIIDALKPFLNVQYSPFWSDENKMLSKAIYDGHIFLDKNSGSFRVIEGKEEFKKSLDKVDLRIIKHLLDLKLITQNAQVSALGGLFQNVQELDDRRGYQMEYILYHYFSKSKKSEIVENYTSTTPIDLFGSFKFENDELAIIDEKAKGDWREFGDIDIALKNEKTYVLGESKAFSTFLSYNSEKGNKKYSEQIHARLQRFVELYSDKIDNSNPNLEFLIIIFRFQFKGFEENILDNDIVKSIISKFKMLENEEIGIKDLKFKPKIKFLGLKCLLDLNHKNISANYTSFYQKPNFKWEIMND
jgi:CRISPR/Cas system-associated protein Csm6